MHSFANIWDIGEDRFLVSFSHDLWGSNGVTFGAGREKGRIRCMKLAVKALKKLSGCVSTTEFWVVFQS